MQLPQRNAELGGDRGRRERGAMQIAQQDFARGMEVARMQRGTDLILARPQASARKQRTASVELFRCWQTMTGKV